MPVPAAADPCPAHLFDWAPSDATELVVVSAAIAAHDLDPSPHDDAATRNVIGRSTECAMQLVRLGADPTRTLNLDMAPDTERSRRYRRKGFDGMMALELARMSQRVELVELMERHARYTPDERAHVVHCRCGSRLPWTSCHSTGIGQPPHYLGGDELGSIMYRVSPLARCPCGNTARTHYDCCWKDTSTPTYLADTGYHIRVVPISGGLGTTFDAFVGTDSSAGNTAKDRVAQYASLLRTDAGVLQRGFATREGPASRVASWDPEVYAGCLERLGDGNDYFLWTDLHWKVDKSELLRRAQAWNEALKKYCRDKGLVGQERAQVISKHKADPCAPCGHVGCKTFEKEPKEFRRCSICKLIAYCGPACQKKDWAEHRATCVPVRSHD
jgi:MYND finger